MSRGFDAPAMTALHLVIGRYQQLGRCGTMLFPSCAQSLGWRGIASPQFNGRAAQLRSASNITSYPKTEAQPRDDQNSSTSEVSYLERPEASKVVSLTRDEAQT